MDRPKVAIGHTRRPRRPWSNWPRLRRGAVWALARLAIQESLRRNVLVALGVFLVLLLFGGWFLDTTSNDPSVLLMTFVLTGITWLSWAMAVFLSAFSLPSDFKTHTIYTIVTKPVRSGEIVLGRILGFTIIGTVMLVVMGLASYIFAMRLLSHSHEVDLSTVETTVKGSGAETTARTSLAHGHRHTVTFRDGRTTTDLRNSHWHNLNVDETVRPGRPAGHHAQEPGREAVLRNSAPGCGPTAGPGARGGPTRGGSKAATGDPLENRIARAEQHSRAANPARGQSPRRNGVGRKQQARRRVDGRRAAEAKPADGETPKTDANTESAEPSADGEKAAAEKPAEDATPAAEKPADEKPAPAESKPKPAKPLPPVKKNDPPAQPARKVAADGTVDLGVFGQLQVGGKPIAEVRKLIAEHVQADPPEAGLTIDFVPNRAEALTVSGPEGAFMARVPVWGELTFKDRSGKGTARGISVGKEWTYRSFIEGGTVAAAIWTFQNITPERFPDGLPVEMTIRVFRSHKGKIDRGIYGSLTVRNPQTGRATREIQFQAKDAIIDRQDIPIKLSDSQGEPLDLFKDLTADGAVQIEIKCIEPGQYFGMAMPDLYLRAQDASFELNLVKAFFGIWLTMVFVISFAVMFSTFLSGPVAMMATVAVLIIGLFTQNILELAHGIQVGGGLFESIIRIVKQQNMTLEMDEGLTRTVVQSVDWVLLKVMEGIALMLPDLSKFNEAFITPVAKGFDISNDAVGIWAVRGLAYLCVVFVVGYFFLKTREVAK